MASTKSKYRHAHHHAIVETCQGTRWGQRIDLWLQNLRHWCVDLPRPNDSLCLWLDLPCCLDQQKGLLREEVWRIHLYERWSRAHSQEQPQACVGRLFRSFLCCYVWNRTWLTLQRSDDSVRYASWCCISHRNVSDHVHNNRSYYQRANQLKTEHPIRRNDYHFYDHRNNARPLHSNLDRQEDRTYTVHRTDFTVLSRFLHGHYPSTFNYRSCTRQ